MNKNGEEEENRPHKIVRKKEEEEDEHRGVKISSTKIWVFRSQNRFKKMVYKDTHLKSPRWD